MVPSIRDETRAVRFAAIIPVGPSAAEHARLQELLESLCCYEPQVWRILLVEDGVRNAPLNYSPLVISKLERVANPRNGHGLPVTGGLCAGMLAGLKHCVTALPSPIDFAVKLDTDALVIAPFSAKLARLFHKRPEVGMAGAHRETPNRESRNFDEWRELIQDLAGQWINSARRRRRAGRCIPTAWWGKPARMRRQVRDALAAGYEAGDNILGGAYALSGNAIRALSHQGLLDDPLLWLNTSLGEDVLVSMLVNSVGQQLAGFCADNEVFGVRYQGLPDAPDRLIERGYSIIHSTKNDHGHREEDIRSFFAKVRQRSSPIPKAS